MSAKLSDHQDQWIHVLFKGERLSEDEPSIDDDYLQEFEKKNLLAISVPILQFEFKNIDKLVNCLNSLKYEDQNGLIITSPRVVKSLQEALKLSQSCGILQNLKSDLVFVVGEKSAKLCSETLNLEYNRVSATSGNGRELAKFIQNHCAKLKSKCRLIYPKSSLGDKTIESMLNVENELSMEAIEVYDTKTIQNIDEALIDKLQHVKYLCQDSRVLIINLVFFSPSGLCGFFKINQQELVKRISNLFNPCKVEFKYSCIGKTTEAALNCFGLESFCTAVQPKPESLTESLRNKCD